MKKTTANIKISVMEERPVITLELKTIDKIFEIMGWLSIIAIWGLTITSYTNLPDIIPTHYDGKGQVDGSGNKATILTLPVIATLLFVVLTIINRYPHIFNFMTIITKKNAFRQYTLATRTIRYLKLVIVIIFGLITFKTIQNANGQEEGLGIWFLPQMLGLIFIPMTYFLIKSLKTKQ